MTLELAKEPLQIHSGTCSRQTIHSKETLPLLTGQHMHDGAAAVIWQMNRLIWGRWEQGRLRLSDNSEWDDVYVLEARIFNEAEELHVYRTGGTYTGRYVCDGQGDQACEYADSLARLWGEAASSAQTAEGFVALIDAQRHLHMDVPAAKGAAYYDLITRNYIGVHDQTGQAGYVDFRFKAIVPEGGR